MAFYYYNENTDDKGRHEVHTGDCKRPPFPQNRAYLGIFHSCDAAIKHAKNVFPSKNFDGCYWCSRTCHKG